jgi:hypothetical protein
MLLPMFGFLLTLLGVGALGTLVAKGDPQHARTAPYIGFTSLFAALGALALSICLGLLGGAVDMLFDTMVFGPAGFFGGYAFGLLGGALAGLRIAIRRSRPLNLP